MPKTPPKSPAAEPAETPAGLDHRALALAYRPQTFADVAGQRHVTDVLAKAVEHNRVAHAYLFSGPRGTGKTTTARILAKVLNCPNRKGSEPCNVCDTCRDITSGVSLDVVEIDAASNRGIADIQQLREAVRFAATGGRSKVYIIDEVHQLSGDAFAALLKTLEEPPPHVVFIFATTDPLKLPDTIRSRTQRYEFARVAVKTIAERLKTIAALETKAGRTLELTDGAAYLITRKAEGGLRDAVSALDQVASTGRVLIDEAAISEVLGLVSREAFFDLADPIFGRDPAATLAQLHRAYAGGFDPRDLADGLLEHLRNVLVIKVDPNAGELLAATPEEVARYAEQGAQHSSADVLRLLRIATDTIGLLREASQPLLHLEAGLLEMAHLEPGRTLAEILERLDAIETSPSGGEACPRGPLLPRPRRRRAPRLRHRWCARPSAAEAVDPRARVRPPDAHARAARAERPAARTRGVRSARHVGEGGRAAAPAQAHARPLPRGGAPARLAGRRARARGRSGTPRADRASRQPRADRRRARRGLRPHARLPLRRWNSGRGRSAAARAAGRPEIPPRRTSKAYKTYALDNRRRKTSPQPRRRKARARRRASTRPSCRRRRGTLCYGWKARSSGPRVRTRHPREARHEEPEHRRDDEAGADDAVAHAGSAGRGRPEDGRGLGRRRHGDGHGERQVRDPVGQARP